jgi:hypothetical protein
MFLGQAGAGQKHQNDEGWFKTTYMYTSSLEKDDPHVEGISPVRPELFLNHLRALTAARIHGFSACHV